MGELMSDVSREAATRPGAGPLGWTRTEDGIVSVTLQRPDRMNSLTPEVLDAFEVLLTELEADPDVRAVVIAGEGRAFCVGMDHDFLKDCFADKTGTFFPFSARYHEVLRRFEALPAIVIAAVDGITRAGGFELVIACDLVVATTRARIADHHIVFSMIPGAGATARAVHKLGDQRARELMLTGRWLAGHEIAEAGVACRVVEPAGLSAALEEILDRLRPLSRPALARMKSIVNRCADLPLEAALEYEFSEFQDYLLTEPSSDEKFRAWTSAR
jgi:enoyl-CoA hydratase/carnithine racemase